MDTEKATIPPAETPETGIRSNTAYQEAFAYFEEASTRFDTKPADLESRDKRAFRAIEDAYHTALSALDAIIDAHTARLVADALLAAQEDNR